MNDPRAFILANTEIVAPALIPEMRLRLATEIVPIWQATEAALVRMNVPPPFWAFCWPGGQAIARYVLDHPAVVNGRIVLDFAAGCGVGAIAAACAGARSFANDIDAMAISAIGLNADLNGVTIETEPRNLLDRPPEGWEVILAGDVCYERGLAERIWAWLRVAAEAGTLVLLGDPGRTYLPKMGLAAVTSYSVPTTRELEDGEMKDTTVWRVI